MNKNWSGWASFCAGFALTVLTCSPAYANPPDPVPEPPPPLPPLIEVIGARIHPVPLVPLITVLPAPRWISNNHPLITGDFGNSSPSEPTPPVPDKEGIPDRCEGEDTQIAKNPVIIKTGKKVIEEVDFAEQGEMGLKLVRMYQPLSGMFMTRWRSNLDYGLIFYYSNGTNCSRAAMSFNQDCVTPVGHTVTQLTTLRPDGATYTFTWEAANGRWEDAKPQSINWIESLLNRPGFPGGSNL